MKYLNKPIARGMKQRQMDMVRMYRNILKKEHFNDELEGMVEIMQKELTQEFRKYGIIYKHMIISNSCFSLFF